MADLCGLVEASAGRPGAARRPCCRRSVGQRHAARRARRPERLCGLGVDAFQRRHRWLGFLLAVIYEFADDQGGCLAALVTYYGFLSLVPAGAPAGDDRSASRCRAIPPCRRSCSTRRWRSSRSSAARCATASGQPSGSGTGLAVGIAASTGYGSLGAAQATRTRSAACGSVPPATCGPIRSCRGCAACVLVVGDRGRACWLTTGLSAVTTGPDAAAAPRSEAACGWPRSRWRSSRTIGVFLLAFRGLDRALRCRRGTCACGAIVAAIGWQVVQLLGTYLVTHALKGTRESYGVFGLVLGPQRMDLRARAGHRDRR